MCSRQRSATVVKFYGVSGGEYFNVVAQEGDDFPKVRERCAEVMRPRPRPRLGLEAWGGDAIVKGDDFSIVDFNDWPSFSRVRDAAARAIARRSLLHLRRHPAARDLNV